MFALSAEGMVGRRDGLVMIEVSLRAGGTQGRVDQMMSTYIYIYEGRSCACSVVNCRDVAGLFAFLSGNLFGVFVEVSLLEVSRLQ